MKRHQKHENKKQAFTLVELIIVIVILSILATIGFISFQNYSWNARDWNRLSTIKNIQTGLELYVMKTWKYPTPEWEIQTGTLWWWDFAYKWEIQTWISRQIWLNKAPQDPETKNNYTYSTTKTQTQYEIGSVLEWDIAYTRVVPTIYALWEYKAKVEWNYIWYAKYKNNDEDCISYANIPSIIWSNTWSVNLLSTGSESQETPLYVINNEKNLPYFQEKQTEKILPDEVIKRKTKKENAKIITICEYTLEEIWDNWEEISQEEKEIIESFWKTTPKEIRETILWKITPVTYASCDGIWHGSKKMFYKSSSVAYWNTCEPWIEFECRNGEWKHITVNKTEYPSEVECVEWTPKRCEISATNDGYSLWDPLEHGSGSTLTKEDVSFENGEKILSQEFHCDNWDLVKRETPETWEITKCDMDYYAHNDLCEWVWIWYYSPDESIAKIECDNKKWNSIYTTSWSWANACEYSCETWYEGSNCSPKGKTVASGVYNGRTFSFTSFVLSYGTPQTKTSSALTISWGTSILTATFTLWSNGTDVTPSNQSENIVCNAGFSLVGSDCKRNIVAYDGRKRWSDDTYATSCNKYKNPTGNYTYTGAVGDGVYWIKPDTNAAFKVYCDMTTDWWGWTIITNSFVNNSWNTSKPFDVNWATITTLWVWDITNISNNFHISINRYLALANISKPVQYVIYGKSGKASDPWQKTLEYSGHYLANDWFYTWMWTYVNWRPNGNTGMKLTTNNQDNDIHPSLNCAQWAGSFYWYSWCHDSHFWSSSMDLSNTCSPGVAESYSLIGTNYNFWWTAVCNWYSNYWPDAGWAHNTWYQAKIMIR